ncbi:MAG: F0F1 ATP synthase subunit epsilon [Muribaculaceae bacterium]|nr:F0F1 ATP synthase subunit epsilon [Muribaculaceae bacterium]
MTLKIISPSETVFEGTTKMVTLPGAMGSFTVLRNHASLIAALTAGTIVSRDADSENTRSFEIKGGIADVDNNVISVCIY